MVFQGILEILIVKSAIFYFTTAFFSAITFGNLSINDEMALISIAGIGKRKQEHCGQWGKHKNVKSPPFLHLLMDLQK